MDPVQIPGYTIPFCLSRIPFATAYGYSNYPSAIVCSSADKGSLCSSAGWERREHTNKFLFHPSGHILVCRRPRRCSQAATGVRDGHDGLREKKMICQIFKFLKREIWESFASSKKNFCCFQLYQRKQAQQNLPRCSHTGGFGFWGFFTSKAATLPISRETSCIH